jgi:branched-chain amino acid transport system substrate-binding protein
MTMLFCETAKRAIEAKMAFNGPNLKKALNTIKNFDTGGIVGAPITVVGNSIPVGRVYQYNAGKKQFLPVSDWIKVSKSA